MKKFLAVIMAILTVSVCSMSALTLSAQEDDVKYNIADLFAKGDVNCDGTAETKEDLAELREILLGKKTALSENTADYKAGDGINIVDLFKLKAKVMAS